MGKRRKPKALRLLFLPSHWQRRRKDGSPMPNRIFLEDGTELYGVRSVSCEYPEVTIDCDMVMESRPTQLLTMTIELAAQKISFVKKIPKRRRLEGRRDS